MFQSVSEQEALYAKGRTKHGNIVTYAKSTSYSSMHQWEVAFDDFGNMGFDAGYDANTKAIVIGNKVDEHGINAGGLDVSVKGVNIDGYNYVNLREITKALGREIEIVNGKVVIK